MEQQQEKIFQLYIQQLTGHLSEEEEAYVQRMLAEDPAFAATWAALEAEGKEMDVQGYLHRVDEQAALQQLQQRSLRPASRKRWLAAAAVLLLLLSGGYFFFRSTPATPPLAQIKPPVQLLLANGRQINLDNDSAVRTVSNATLTTGNNMLRYESADTAMNTLQVPAGASYRLMLSDGTEVWLNAATSMRFPFHFSGGSREVYVSGEAYFKVAKHPQQPFTVHTPLTNIQVLGTAFNVNTYHNGNVRTSLVEGKVITSAANGLQTTLQPGYQSDYSAATGFAASRFDEEEVLSWINGVYYFHHMPLPELAAAASRFYGITIVTDPQKHARTATTGIMERDKLSAFLNDLETTAQVKYSYKDGVLHLE
ncbi:DUF4974 domain-containing protein [Chitinophaga sp. Mgbs1]|uniref:DUF4974 domain-containing protein n=1 Tax=Chitinophaga solisilvae TaxID=1233460 RepID=A0A3S1CW92_9BACT|nr:DUF4974 domain-containing protein [Chitinophaga solisilvae]